MKAFELSSNFDVRSVAAGGAVSCSFQRRDPSSCRPRGLDVDSLGTTSNLPAVTSGKPKPIQFITGNPTDPGPQSSQTTSAQQHSSMRTILLLRM